MPDLDAALEWAARCPGRADGAVEVRPAMGSCQATPNGAAAAEPALGVGLSRPWTIWRTLTGPPRRRPGRATAGWSRISRPGRATWPAAEDALGEAFRAALETWPRDGVPEKPEAWLLAVARRRMIDDARHERVKADATPVLRLAAERRQATSSHRMARTRSSPTSD